MALLMCQLHLSKQSFSISIPDKLLGYPKNWVEQQSDLLQSDRGAEIIAIGVSESVEKYNMPIIFFLI